MNRLRTILVTVGILLVIIPSARGGVITDAIGRAGDDLVAQQSGGTWPDASDAAFTGESVAGLAHAYQLTGTGSYKSSAEAGGNYILTDAGYNSGTGTYTYGPYGSGAYAMTFLSEVSSNPSSNSWRTAASNFYEQIRTGNGTQNYVDAWAGQEDSGAVYDIARHTVAAFYADATDKQIWRAGLNGALSDIEDSDESPVMALGIAVWGLAKTGLMDSTVVSFDPSSHFYNVELSHLPGMLVGHQDSDGSFFSKFDHSFASGYTETTAMAALGLIAANDSNPLLGYDDEILNASLVLADGIDAGGQAYWAIGNDLSGQYYFLAGQTLEVLPEPASATLLALGASVLLRCKRRKT